MSAAHCFEIESLSSFFDVRPLGFGLAGAGPDTRHPRVSLNSHHSSAQSGKMESERHTVWHGHGTRAIFRIQISDPLALDSQINHTHDADQRL